MSKYVINIEPTWREILPALLALLENPDTQRIALDELSRLTASIDGVNVYIPKLRLVR